jgi:hypothetical protein
MENSCFRFRSFTFIPKTVQQDSWAAPPKIEHVSMLALACLTLLEMYYEGDNGLKEGKKVTAKCCKSGKRTRKCAHRRSQFIELL